MKYIYSYWWWFLAHHALLHFGEGTADPPTPTACRGSFSLCFFWSWTFWLTDCVFDVLFYVRWSVWYFRGAPNLGFEQTVRVKSWFSRNTHFRETNEQPLIFTYGEHAGNIAQTLQSIAKTSKYHARIMPELSHNHVIIIQKKNIVMPKSSKINLILIT